MEYTTRMGSGPGRAHVNYQCPCGCIGGVIYSEAKPLAKAGACCCGRKLWVGEQAEARIRPFLDAGVDYEWDLGSVTLPWGAVAATAMAWPAGSDAGHPEAPPSPTAAKVTDPVCKMSFLPEEAAATREYRATTYYFCAPACAERFEANPRQFVTAAPSLFNRLRRRS
jgi:YHS domain-containing protein